MRLDIMGKTYWKCELSDFKGRCMKSDNIIEETNGNNHDNHDSDTVNISEVS